MVNAIVDGNAIADWAFVNGQKSELFNIPAALHLLGSNFDEISYVTTKSQHGDAQSLLYGNIKSAIEHPSLSDWKQLFFLTMFVERCVLIVYERDTDSIAILDSHTHRYFGALIAVSQHGNFHQFCAFIIRHFFPETLKLKPAKMVKLFNNFFLKQT
uniref:Uncharacterized protein n=1 Tax=Panagrolaimus superbus TaxID=310955 RepID=A0A914Y6T2_9BILA